MSLAETMFSRLGLLVLKTAENARLALGAPELTDELLATASSVLFPPEEGVVEEQQLTSVGTARWASCGYPTIEIGHKFAAALLVSNITADLLANLKPPWRAFMIRVPNGLIEIYDDGRRGNKPAGYYPICCILVTQIRGKRGDWSYAAQSELPPKGPGTTIWRYGVPPELLLPPHSDNFIPNKGNLDITDADGRAQTLIGRLIVTTCAALTMPNMTEELGGGHAAWKAAKERPLHAPPIPRIFKLGKPITVDFRDRVRAFVRGEREAGEIEVRTMVMGHFRRQHHGPKNSLVKTIWVEPFWRGPDEAPVLVRPHILQEDQK